MISGSSEFQRKYPLYGIFSDVDINFHSNNLTSVTSLALDREAKSRRSSNNLPTEIKQLIIDIQALDDADIAYWVKTHPNTSTDSINIHERMPRFTRAFDLFCNIETRSLTKVSDLFCFVRTVRHSALHTTPPLAFIYIRKAGGGVVYGAYFSNSFATSCSSLRMGRCWGQICSHLPQRMQSDARTSS